MAITTTREVHLASAHACGDEIHVQVSEALTVEQSKALRKEMRAAERRAAAATRSPGRLSVQFVRPEDVPEEVRTAFEEFGRSLNEEVPTDGSR